MVAASVGGTLAYIALFPVALAATSSQAKGSKVSSSVNMVYYNLTCCYYASFDVVQPRKKEGEKKGHASFCLMRGKLYLSSTSTESRTCLI